MKVDEGNRTTASNRQSFLLTGLASLLICAMAVPIAQALSGKIREFPLPAGGGPVDITAGPDGNVWFTEIGGDKIGRITKDGTITEFPVPTPNSYPHGITAGPDGNMWFTEIKGNKIGRTTPEGKVTEFAIGTFCSQPHDIAAGPDGNLWFVEGNADKIGRITLQGEITEYPLPTAPTTPNCTGFASTSPSQPYVIVAGPDGNLWFTEAKSNKIGLITTAGSLTEFLVPTANSQPDGITVGPDGNLWFTEFTANKVGVISTGGTFLAEIPVPTAHSGPHDITVGPDQKLWFTELSANKIGRMNPYHDSEIDEIPVPATSTSSFGNLFGITAGPKESFRNHESDFGHQGPDDDGYIWFVKLSDNQIGRLRWSQDEQR
jgi:streptogramin lyase